jgi:hypothetical protein
MRLKKTTSENSTIPSTSKEQINENINNSSRLAARPEPKPRRSVDTSNDLKFNQKIKNG